MYFAIFKRNWHRCALFNESVEYAQTQSNSMHNEVNWMENIQMERIQCIQSACIRTEWFDEERIRFVECSAIGFFGQNIQHHDYVRWTRRLEDETNFKPKWKLVHIIFRNFMFIIFNLNPAECGPYVSIATAFIESHLRRFLGTNHHHQQIIEKKWK